MKTKILLLHIAGNIFFYFAINAQTLTNGLIAYYPFNGNSNDESGNGNHGVVFGSLLVNDRCGIANSAYYFDGVDDYIQVYSNFLLNEVTICGWIEASAVPQDGGIFFKSADYFESTWGLYLRNELHILEDIKDHNQQIYHTTITSDWHFFTMVLTEELVNKLYIDGVLVGTGLKSLDNWASYNGYIYIGQRGTSAWNWYFNGKIDDIRIYNRELDTLEILDLYKTDCSISEINGPREVCQGQQDVNYFIQPIKDASYLWDYTGAGTIINGNTNTVMVDFLNDATDGNLSVTVTGNTSNSKKTEIPITIQKLPESAGNIVGPKEVCMNQGVVNYSLPAIPNAAGYEWNYSGTGAVITGNSNGIDIQFADNATSGSLSVYGYNECGDGKSSPEYPITVDLCNDVDSTLNIPNAFSPNGDGINDLFMIKGLTENSRLIIFDRTGRKLYHSENYLNDWDGKDNEGKDLKTGTYWYVLILPGIHANFKGFVYLKR